MPASIFKGSTDCLGGGANRASHSAGPLSPTASLASSRIWPTSYREKVTQLTRGLVHEESRTAAADALRGLIDAIVLTPQAGELRIELQGNLAAMLEAAQAQSSGSSLAPLGRWEDGRSRHNNDLVQIRLVAGAGCEP